MGYNSRPVSERDWVRQKLSMKMSLQELIPMQRYKKATHRRGRAVPGPLEIMRSGLTVHSRDSDENRATSVVNIEWIHDWPTCGVTEIHQ